MLKKQKVYIPYLNEKRRIHIYLPNHPQPNERFDVLYMFDGHNLFEDTEATYGKSWGLKQYFDKQQLRTMIVGVECNHIGNLRLCEFSPYSFKDKDWGVVDASGKAFMSWMSHDLKRYIDQNYPTNPTNTYLAGSSMGGLMALYGGATYPNIYKGVACLSCYFEHVYKSLYAELSQLPDFEASTFYMSTGANEWRTKNGYAKWMQQNLNLMNLLTKKKATVYLHTYPKGEHSEASWEKEIPVFLNDLNIK